MWDTIINLIYRKFLKVSLSGIARSQLAQEFQGAGFLAQLSIEKSAVTGLERRPSRPLVDPEPPRWHLELGALPASRVPSLGTSKVHPP